ncbi:MAG: hypothetical protein SFY80_05730 [Verrucomicrobiota bacterium]|nr:hypothetical protein [Verrucomicrobiota bacterium]
MKRVVPLLVFLAAVATAVAGDADSVTDKSLAEIAEPLLEKSSTASEAKVFPAIPTDIADKARIKENLYIRTIIEKARAGEAEAQYRLGCLIAYESREPKHYVIARDWLERADKQGYQDAPMTLCYLYLDGHEGIPKNYALALEYAHSAYDRGDCAATCMISEFHNKGWGVPVDMASAHRWIRMAESCEESQAWNAVAWFYATTPEPLYREPGKAVEFAKKAVAAQPRSNAYLDTLAAAQALAGNFKQAIVAQKLAIKYVDTFEDGHEKLLAEFEARLKLYQAGKIYVDRPETK